MDSDVLPGLDLKVGDNKIVNVSFSQQGVKSYMELTGDVNPIHWNEDYTALTFFGRPIVHGTFMLGALSRVLGTTFPGRGTVVTSLTSKFSRPVYYNIQPEYNNNTVNLALPTTVKLALEVTEVDKGQATISYKFYSTDMNNKPQYICEGEVTVRNVWDITRSKNDRSKTTKKTTSAGKDSANSSQKQQSLDAVPQGTSGSSAGKV